MLRLKLITEPYWLDLPYGVRVKVRPATTVITSHARATCNRLIGELMDDIARHQEVGDVTGLPDMSDPDVRAATAALLTFISYARAAIIEWQGVTMEDGVTPAPVNQITTADLMRIHPIGETFLQQYLAPLDALAAEGNASRPVQNGTGGTGPTIAPAAETRGQNASTVQEVALAIDAPTSNTLQ